jgi:hypothetical protein
MIKIPILGLLSNSNFTFVEGPQLRLCLCLPLYITMWCPLLGSKRCCLKLVASILKSLTKSTSLEKEHYLVFFEILKERAHDSLNCLYP